MTDLNLKLVYPGYIGRPEEYVKGSGDIIVPFGTKVYWDIRTRLADRVELEFEGNHAVSAQRAGDNRFTF